MNSAPPPIPTSAPKKSGMPTWALVLIIVGSVGIVMVAVIGLLAAIAIPNFVRAREMAQRNICINNLRQIDSAKIGWAMKYKKENGESVDENVINGYLKNGARPICVKGGIYVYSPVGTEPSCSIHGTLSEAETERTSRGRY